MIMISHDNNNSCFPIRISSMIHGAKIVNNIPMCIKCVISVNIFKQKNISLLTTCVVLWHNSDRFACLFL